MLPITTLDDENFREITENARSMISMLNPDWTDFNYHDPGITFLELFAFLKESQQYHLDQIGSAQRRKYLKLLGMSPAHRAPARTRTAITGLDGVTLPRMTRLLAEDIPFETERPVSCGGGRLRDGFTWDGARRTTFDTGAYAETGKLQMEVFGREPQPGAAWYLRFDGEPKGLLRLWLWVRQDWPVRRNPVGDMDFIPLAELAWEYLAPDGWRTLTVVEDGTRGLLFSGEVALQTDGSHGAAEETLNTNEPSDLADGWWMRVRLVSGGYDVPPIVTGLSDRMVPVVQRETKADWGIFSVQNRQLCADAVLAGSGEYEVYCGNPDGSWSLAKHVTRWVDARAGVTWFTLPKTTKRALLTVWRRDFAALRHLGAGDGFPNQTRNLEEKGQLYECFQLLISEADRPDIWRLWDKVDDFDASGPEDCHYVLDEETGIVRFGDCIHGLAPEGKILVVGEAVTLGEQGNVKAGRMRAVHPADAAAWGIPGEVFVHSPDNADGGRSRESEEACLLRCRRTLRRTERAVTYEDYERLVRSAPGLMISNCKAVPVDRLPRQDGSLEENCVTVVVEPYSARREKMLNEVYEKNILRYLENRRMLGTKVTLLAPEYIGISVYAEILSQPQYVDARERIRAAVEAFFAEGWEFGAPVRYSALYGIIDTLDCVSGVETLTIDAQGMGITRGINGDVILPYNALAALQSAAYQVRPAE